MFDVSAPNSSLNGVASEFGSPTERPEIHVREVLETGIIRVSGSGNWSPAMVEGALNAVDELKEAHASKGEIALILIDMRQANIQQSQMAARFMRLAQHAEHGCHRIAVLVDTSLIKMEMKKVAPDLMAEFFLSPNAAETWLTAYR